MKVKCICCIAENDNNTDVYNQFLYFSFYYPKCTMGKSEREKENERERERERERDEEGWTEHTGRMVRIIWETSRLFCSSSRNLPIYKIFRALTQNLWVKPTAYTLPTDTPPSSCPSTKLTWLRFLFACQPRNLRSISARVPASFLI